MIVVRNPFDRLVSCYNDKVVNAEWSWNKIYTMKKFLRGETKLRKKLEFSEFVKYITERYFKDRDRHYARYHEMCFPCSIDYDFVIKLETLATDLPILLEKMSLNKSVIRELAAKNNHRSPSSFTRNLPEYKNVSLELTKKLYGLYELDFELFGYTYDFDSQDGKCDSGAEGCC